MRGAYFVLEGGDGCGKSTQAELLCRWLRDELGRRVQHVREPGSTPLADSLRELLLDDVGRDIEPVTEALLFFAARRELLQRTIEPALARGEVVVAERSFVSTIVYQSLAPIEDVQRVPLSVVTEMARTVHGDTWPDAVIVLDVDLATGLSRLGDRAELDRIESRGAAFASRVRDAFLEIARSDVLAELLGGQEHVVVLDANGSPEEIRDRLRDVARAVFDRFPPTEKNAP